MTPVEVELYRAASRDPDLATRVLDVFSRTRRPARAVPPRRAVTVAARALRRPATTRAAAARAVADEAGRALATGIRLRRLPR
jgi:hypothetical protein